jgi:hypothetical protein
MPPQTKGISNYLFLNLTPGSFSWPGVLNLIFKHYMSDYIIREKLELNFAQVPKPALKDRNLSLKAKGLYAYLFSLPEDWKVFKTEIVKNFSDGKDSLNAAFKELEKFGYLTAKTVRDEGTKQFKGTTLTLRIYPEEEKPLRETRSGKAADGKTVHGKPAGTNNDNTNSLPNDISLFNNKECNAFDCFIKDFNKIRKSKFQPIAKVKTAFKNRLKTHTSKDMLRALENAMKEPYHIENEFNDLTPEFITRADKLEKYLNYVPKKKDTQANGATIIL